MNKTLAALAALLLTASLSGCTGVSKSMSLDEFGEFCNDEFGYAEDCDSGSICATYRQALDRQFASVKECTSLCNKIDSELWMQNVMTECSAVVGNATDWCEQYCHRNVKP